MDLDGREKLFAAFGALGVVIGVVALVIAIGAKNDANDEQSAADQAAKSLEAQLTDKADQLKSDLEADVAKTGTVEKKAKQAQKKGAKAEKAGKKAQKTGNAAAAQAESNTKDITALQDENAKLKKQVSDLESAQTQTQNQVDTLQLKLKDKANK